jgi:hypothetical protein
MPSACAGEARGSAVRVACGATAGAAARFPRRRRRPGPTFGHPRRGPGLSPGRATYIASIAAGGQAPGIVSRSGPPGHPAMAARRRRPPPDTPAGPWAPDTTAGPQAVALKGDLHRFDCRWRPGTGYRVALRATRAPGDGGAAPRASSGHTGRAVGSGHGGGAPGCRPEGRPTSLRLPPRTDQHGTTAPRPPGNVSGRPATCPRRCHPDPFGLAAGAPGYRPEGRPTSLRLPLEARHRASCRGAGHPGTRRWRRGAQGLLRTRRRGLGLRTRRRGPALSP